MTEIIELLNKLLQTLSKTITQPLKFFFIQWNFCHSGLDPNVHEGLLRLRVFYCTSSESFIFFLSWTPGEQAHMSNFLQGPIDLKETVSHLFAASNLKWWFGPFYVFERGQKQGYRRKISASGTNGVINNLGKLSGTFVTSQRAPISLSSFLRQARDTGYC